MLGSYQSNQSVDHWRATKKVMRYLQGTMDYKLMYRRVDNLEVIETSDVNFDGYDDSQKSMFSYIFMLADGAISWRRARRTLIAIAIMEAVELYGQSGISAGTDTILRTESRLIKKLGKYWENRRYFGEISSLYVTCVG